MELVSASLVQTPCLTEVMSMTLVHCLCLYMRNSWVLWKYANVCVSYTNTVCVFTEGVVVSCRSRLMFVSLVQTLCFVERMVVSCRIKLMFVSRVQTLFASYRNERRFC